MTLKHFFRTFILFCAIFFICQIASYFIFKTFVLFKDKETFFFVVFFVSSIISSLIISIITNVFFLNRVLRPIENIVAGMKNYPSRISFKNTVSNPIYKLIVLTGFLNRLFAKIEKQINELTLKNITLECVIDSSINGIIVVDKNFKILLFNDIAKKIFGISCDTNTSGINLIEVVRNNQINNFISETFENKLPISTEADINPLESKILKIRTNLILSKDLKEIFGVVLILQDITNIRKLELIRTDFVSNVTHELKTPLTSIRGFIETLRNGAINDPEVSERFLEIIDIEAERLYNLINDILQLSEIEHKHNDSDISTHTLKPVVEEVFEILQGEASKKELCLLCDINEDLKININKNRLKQLLINLVENAIKYNLGNGTILVKSQIQDGIVSISIKDSGIGIPEEHLERIFERFYRVDKGRSRNMGGTGLGLSIVKHIVNLYNGDIQVKSTLGKGTEFIIRLP